MGRRCAWFCICDWCKREVPGSQYGSPDGWVVIEGKAKDLGPRPTDSLLRGFWECASRGEDPITGEHVGVPKEPDELLCVDCNARREDALTRARSITIVDGAR